MQAQASGGRLALLYPGDRAARERADPHEGRFAALFEALAAAGIPAEPAVYNDDFADEVAQQLRAVRGVLVWCNPIESGRRRDRLDALLREAAATGTFVSAHPDTILKLGTKDVLWHTRHLPFGSDVHRVESLAQLTAELPQRLRTGPRVLKQHRGHSGIGIWRVELLDDTVSYAGEPLLRLHHAQRGSEEETVSLPELARRMAPYFEPAQGGHMLDQAWQARLAEGMLRAYLVGDQVAGFGHQAINALYPAVAGQAAPQPGPRRYHPADEPAFQGLRRRLESGWVDSLCQSLGLARTQLPLLWDCDFIPGAPTAHGDEAYVLCEVNVSSVSPFPPSCIAPLVAAVQAALNPPCEGM